jgi:hypothetical protein
MNIDRDMGMGTAYSRTPGTACRGEKTPGPFIRSYYLEAEGNHG